VGPRRTGPRNDIDRPPRNIMPPLPRCGRNLVRYEGREIRVDARCRDMFLPNTRADVNLDGVGVVASWVGHLRAIRPGRAGHGRGGRSRTRPCPETSYYFYYNFPTIAIHIRDFSRPVWLAVAWTILPFRPNIAKVCHPQLLMDTVLPTG
jgi:hypothetical protein